jgi:hypothetical protein
MSGFSNEGGGGQNAKYANFSKGMLVTRIDGEKKTFRSLTGTIIDIDVQDAEFEGKPYRKIVLFIDHIDGVTQLGFGLSSGYGNAFCRILPNIDITKEVTISGGQTPDPKGGDKKYSSLFVMQDEAYVKWYFTKDNAAGKKIPAVVDMKDKKGKVIGKDYSDRETFFEKVIVKKLSAIQELHGDAAKKLKKKPIKDEDTEPVDDLPF